MPISMTIAHNGDGCIDIMAASVICDHSMPVEHEQRVAARDNRRYWCHRYSDLELLYVIGHYIDVPMYLDTTMALDTIAHAISLAHLRVFSF